MRRCSSGMDVLGLLLIIVNAALAGAVYAEFHGIFAESDAALAPRARPTRRPTLRG
ncbi:MAG: hypothetical protein AB7S71_12255 [Dongiaceae bacterium]